MNPTSSSTGSTTRTSRRPSRRSQRPVPQGRAGHADQPDSRSESTPHAQDRESQSTQPRPLELSRPGSALERVAGDPSEGPIPGNAQIKLELQPRTNTELVSFCRSHTDAIKDNPWFEDPVPSPETLEEMLAAYNAKIIEVENIRLLAQNLTAQRERMRQAVEALMNQRANYVQLTSRGNPTVIASAALPIRRARRRTGVLPFPSNLRLRVSQTSGQMLVSWETVAGARGYLVECALIVDDEPLIWTNIYVGGQLQFIAQDLAPGYRHAFRILAIGGADGRSPWSPVVERMVA